MYKASVKLRDLISLFVFGPLWTYYALVESYKIARVF